MFFDPVPGGICCHLPGDKDIFPVKSNHQEAVEFVNSLTILWIGFQPTIYRLAMVVSDNTGPSNKRKNSSDSPATTRFNVRGTIFEISKTLLNQHSGTRLARMATEAQDSQSSEVLVERDPVLFGLILSFMRTGVVTLPVRLVSRQDLLQELEFYGFASTTPMVIQLSPSLKESMEHIGRLRKALRTYKHQRLDEGKHLMDCITVCERLFDHYADTGRLEFSIKCDCHCDSRRFINVCANPNKQPLHDSLRCVGLTCTSMAMDSHKTLAASLALLDAHDVFEQP